MWCFQHFGTPVLLLSCWLKDVPWHGIVCTAASIQTIFQTPRQWVYSLVLLCLILVLLIYMWPLVVKYGTSCPITTIKIFRTSQIQRPIQWECWKSLRRFFEVVPFKHASGYLVQLLGDHYHDSHLLIVGANILNKLLVDLLFITKLLSAVLWIECTSANSNTGFHTAVKCPIVQDVIFV